MMKPKKYPAAIRFLHWLMAAAVIVQITMGFLMEDLGKEIVLIHAGIGFTILLLVTIRLILLLRLKASLPPKPEEFSEKEWKIAKIGHALIYVLLISVPVSGALGFFSGEHDLMEIHESLVWIFILLLAGHILITIKHQLIDKKTIMQRMT